MKLSLHFSFQIGVWKWKNPPHNTHCYVAFTRNFVGRFWETVRHIIVVFNTHNYMTCIIDTFFSLTQALEPWLWHKQQVDFGWFSCHIIMKSCVGSMAGIITNQNHRIILCLNLPHLVTASVTIRQIPIRCVYYEWIPFYHSFSWNQWAKNITKFTPCNYLLLNSKLQYYCVIDVLNSHHILTYDKMELSTLKSLRVEATPDKSICFWRYDVIYLMWSTSSFISHFFSSFSVDRRLQVVYHSPVIIIQ